MTLNGYDIAGVNGPGIITRALTGDFVICKASEGKGFVDKLHDQFVKQIRDAGVLVGHYHYAWPENGGRADAENFLACAKAQPGDVVALDFEPFKTTAPVSVWGRYVIEFAHVVHDKLFCWPWLYSEDYHLTRLVGLPEAEWITRVLPLWKAGVNNAYTGDPNKGPGKTYGFQRLAAYQWGADRIDTDVFYGDRRLWAALAVGGVALPPKPPPPPDLSAEEFIRTAVFA